VRCRHRCDVVIVGAGPAGSVIARNLAAAGLRVLVIEKSRFTAPRVGEFLPPSARTTLKRFRILNSGWEEDHVEANEFLSCWGSANPALRNYVFNAHGHGLVLDRAKFDLSLSDAARVAGATLLKSTCLVDAARSNGVWKLKLRQHASNFEAECLFLVVSAGRYGRRIGWLNTHRRRVDRLVCFGMRIDGYRGDTRPCVETYDEGWIYSVTLPSGQLLINLFIETDRGSQRFLHKSLAFLLHEIRNCPITCSRIMQSNPQGGQGVNTFITDACSGCTRPAAGPGWCLAGDYAQSMDPLSSSGIEQALTHASIVSDEILKSTEIGTVTMRDYCLGLDKSFATYLADRSKVYHLEQRWSSAFWLRRRSDASSGVYLQKSSFLLAH
jgi:flavin-dependent dehydrogenase